MKSVTKEQWKKYEELSAKLSNLISQAQDAQDELVRFVEEEFEIEEGKDYYWETIQSDYEWVYGIDEMGMCKVLEKNGFDFKEVEQ